MNKQTITSLILVLAALLPITASAQDYYDAAVQPKGNGMAENPYKVETPENLLWIAEQVNSGIDFAGLNFEQVNDIDIAATRNWDEGRGWAAIGGVQIINGRLVKLSFRGNYDGKNHKISNLYINRMTDFQGLFGYVYSGTVRNLTIENAQITGLENIGVLAGYAFEENIENCHVKKSVINSSGIYLGGLLGYQSDGTTANCSVEADITGYDYIGGLTSWCVDGKITGCSTAGSIKTIENATDDRLGRVAGGIAGFLSSCTMSECMTTARVEGGNQIGGVAGTAVKSTIEKSFAAGTVKGITYVGGFMGKNEETSISDCYARSEVEGDVSVGGFIGSLDYAGSDIVRCYSTGKVTAFNNQTAAGFVGNKSYTATIKDCYYDKETSAQGEAVGGFSHNDCDCKPMTTEQMKSQDTFDGWDFNNVWSIDKNRNDGYPILKSSPVTASIGTTIINEPDVRVYIAGGQLNVASSQVPLARVEAFALDGTQLFEIKCNNANAVTYSLPDNSHMVLIIRTILVNGNIATVKAMK